MRYRNVELILNVPIANSVVKEVTEKPVNGATQNDEKTMSDASEHESGSEGSESGSEGEEVNGKASADDKANEQESGSEGGDGDRDEENEDEEEEDIPLSDLSGDERTDVIPHQRLTINNSAAINGVCGAGFKMMLLPAANAGPIL